MRVSESFARLLRLTLFGARVGFSGAFAVVGAELVAWETPAPRHAFLWSVSAATGFLVYWNVLGWIFRRGGANKG